MNVIGRTILATLTLCLTTTVMTGVKTHEVAGGESISSIAKHYYGSYDPTDLLLRFNEKPEPVIHAGEKLRIPYSEVHRVTSGDTWSVLSDRYLGDVSAYRSIALLNDLSPDEPLQIGQKIVMPVAVPYRLAPGDTLGGVAQRFYGDTERAEVLIAFNAIDDPKRLSVGQAIRVPLTTLRLASKPRAVKPAKKERPERQPEPVVIPPPEPPPLPAEPAPEPEPRFGSEIDQARLAFRHGEFERAREAVEQLKQRVIETGNKDDRAGLLRLQTFVYVAFDLPQQACETYRTLVELEGQGPLSPQAVSPKIRETLGACL